MVAVHISKHSLYRLKITVDCRLCTGPSIHFSLDEDALKITVGCLVCGVVCVWCGVLCFVCVHVVLCVVLVVCGFVCVHVVLCVVLVVQMINDTASLSWHVRAMHLIGWQNTWEQTPGVPTTPSPP